ncbi:MAG: carboxypeptidase-like regulatory domain-containing protein [Candidatus Kapaibacterium sp.]
MKIIIIALLILPFVLFAGDPIPGIGITVEQSPNGVAVKGNTNGRGEFIATGLKEGDYKVTIEMNGVSSVIGDQVNEKITCPSSKSTARIKPISIDLSTKSMYLSKKGYDYYASKSREAGSGMATGRRQHKPVSKTNGSENGLSKADAGKAIGRNVDESSDGVDDDCDGVVEITPMKGGQIKVKVTCK